MVEQSGETGIGYGWGDAPDDAPGSIPRLYRKRWPIMMLSTGVKCGDARILAVSPAPTFSTMAFAAA
jgi:hypothetical protein